MTDAEISSQSIEESLWLSHGQSAAVRKAEQNSIHVMPKMKTKLRDEGWQMFGDDEEQSGEDDSPWHSLSIKAIQPIENHQKASIDSFKRKSLNVKISELCVPSDVSLAPEGDDPKPNGASVKRSRGSRPFMLVVLDPFARARVPLAIMFLAGVILYGSLYQAMTFAPSASTGQKPQASTAAPAASEFAHVVRPQHTQRRSAMHYQRPAAPSGSIEAEVTVPIAAEYGHRHAYQTYP